MKKPARFLRGSGGLLCVVETRGACLPSIEGMRLLVLGLAALLLAACEADPEPIPEATASAIKELQEIKDAIDAMPKCADVWIEGQRLPADYEGCMNGDVLEAGVSSCGGKLFTYEPEGHGFFTDREGVIHDGGTDYADDPLYGTLVDCAR